MDNCIEVLGVSKSFGEEKVLKNVSHTFEKGKIHGIVGNNGSGKTVLMKCICGFLRPDEGKIYVNHVEVGKETDFPEDIGIIIETPGFLPHLSGFQNLKLLASLRKIANDHTIRDTIELVGLDPSLRKPVGKYSLGMRQRLGLAQALMEDPGLLILDEPLNGLDKYMDRQYPGMDKTYRAGYSGTASAGKLRLVLPLLNQGGLSAPINVTLSAAFLTAEEKASITSQNLAIPKIQILGMARSWRMSIWRTLKFPCRIL